MIELPNNCHKTDNCRISFPVICVGLCAAILLLANVSFSQGKYGKFENYDVNDGLSQNSVWQILQDSLGFMWFVTSDGLNRFDGENFKVFRNDPNDSNTLRNNHIGHIVLGTNNDIWISSHNGIDRYNSLKGRVERFYTIHRKEEWWCNIINFDNGLLWFWIQNDGIYALNTRTKKIERYIRWDAIADTNDECYKAINVGTDELWFLFYNKGLVRYHKKSGLKEVICRFKYRLDERVLLKNFGDSLVLFGGVSKENVVGIYHFRTGKMSFFGMNTDVVTDVAILGNDVLISAKENGLFSATLHEFLCGGKIWSGSSLIADKGIFLSVYFDRAGVLWAGTDGAGAYKGIPNYRAFRQYINTASGPKLVKSVFTQDSLIYACSGNNYIDVFKTDGRFVKVLKGAAQGNFKSIAANVRENKTAYWLMGEGCFGIYDLITGTFADYMPAIHKIDTSAKLYLHYCSVHKQGNDTVFAGFGGALFRLNKGGKKTQYVPEIVRHFGDCRITCITSSGSKVAVSTVSDLYLFHTKTNKWERVFGVKTDLIKCLLFYDDSIIWAGTENGLYRCSLNSGAVKRYDEKDGLPNSFIYGIIRHDDHLWISTNKGLSRYSVTGRIFTNYTPDDGLQSNEFNTGAFHKGEGQRLYFGGPNGVNGFHDTDIKDNPFQPITQLTGIRLFDEPLNVDTAYSRMSVLVLPYDKNTLSFEFAALEFSNSKLNQYAYMMEGLDKGWIASGNRRFARYPNLPPGEYRFKIKASNNNGKWQQEPKIINIIITKPYWQRTWFVVLCVILCIVLIVFIVLLLQRQQFRKRLRQIELQQKIQAERERISRDLHDNVGSQISYLVSNIDWITQHEIAEHEKHKRLTSLSDTAQGLMSNMRETIWALNKADISIDEFADKLKAFARHMLQYNDSIRFQSEEYLTNGYVFEPGEALNIFRICQEAVNNAIKHSDASLILLKIWSDGPGTFTLELSDNGKGYMTTETTGSGHYGLDNMKQRAAEYDVLLQVISTIGDGTRVILNKQKVS